MVKISHDSIWGEEESKYVKDIWFDDFIKSHLKQVASNLATFIKNTEQKPNMNELCTSCRETISLCYKVTFRRVFWQK